MELKLITSDKNSYPIKGLLIRGADVELWLTEMQKLDLNLSEVQVFAVPDISANSTWGCCVLMQHADSIAPGRHELLQQVSRNFFISERADIFPVVTPVELDQLFLRCQHVMHPHFGLVELKDEVNFITLIDQPHELEVAVTKPAPSVYIPSQIRNFQVHPLSPDEVLEKLNDNVFPKHEKFNDKPLNIFEKMKLGLYKGLLTEDGKLEGTWLGTLLNKFGVEQRASSNIEADFKSLENRNTNELDKLMDLLKNNPQEALKYAIPLDEGNTGRGGMSQSGNFQMSMRWLNFSLFGNSGQTRTGGPSIDLGNDFYTLENQYRATAEELIRQKEYEKAAFMYMKLLKNYDKAAETMALGNHFQEAATIHLKHTGNKVRAAQCYEKGAMYREAIGLYQELNDHEKAGDLYLTMNNRRMAMESYTRVVDDLKSKNQFVKASLLLRNKMNDVPAGQALLRQGWQKKTDAVNCLALYFSNVTDTEKHRDAVTEIYSADVDSTNCENFLQVMKTEYQSDAGLQEMIREIAFEIVADRVKANPQIVAELKHFNPNNKELVKDTIRFKLRKK